MPKRRVTVNKTDQIVDQIGHNHQHCIPQNIVRFFNQYKNADQVGKPDYYRLDGDKPVVFARFVEPFYHKDVGQNLESEHQIDAAGS